MGRNIADEPLDVLAAITSAEPNKAFEALHMAVWLIKAPDGMEWVAFLRELMGSHFNRAIELTPARAREMIELGEAVTSFMRSKA